MKKNNIKKKIKQKIKEKNISTLKPVEKIISKIRVSFD